MGENWRRISGKSGVKTERKKIRKILGKTRKNIAKKLREKSGKKS